LKAQLERQTFTVSRELEYLTEHELTAQTGYGRQHWWPGVVAKELIDNGLDSCERAGVPPQIQVEMDGDSISVADNGPGLPEQVLTKTLDFTTRTSDKAAYVSPTRGMQGNALKTILAIPYVLSHGVASRVEVAANGVRHLVSVSTDHIRQKPQVEHCTQAIAKTEGTQVRVALDSAC